MIYREITKEFERLLPHFRVLVITGPRQSGKTTLSKAYFSSYTYFNMEDTRIREQIAAAPKAFLEQYAAKGIVIDEAQQYPALFSDIQVIADAHPDYRFVLTGSSNFTLIRNITQSLAGRVALFTLLPLSLAELKDKIAADTDTLLFNGGFPAVWANGTPAYDVCRNYYNTYVERDVRNLINVKNLSKFQTFIRLCAGRVGCEFNASALSNETGVSAPTINEWVSILEASYVLFRLQPFYKNIGKRLVKMPKIYFYDTAMVCFLAGIENAQQLATHPLRGGIFENMAVLEFIKQRYNAGKDANLFFYRDKSQREVDIVQDLGNKYHAYEVKSAKAFHPGFLDNLKYLKNILGDSLVRTQVIYDGETDIPTDENGMVNFRNHLKFKNN
ncbi:MAG: ATP-binding protein [Prevotellaceae bacterium]|jgi:predicted AAA+ superfamily ATPase|nr:ATP-binding protein [Prevotellaceae bacterium]